MSQGTLSPPNVAKNTPAPRKGPVDRISVKLERELMRRVSALAERDKKDKQEYLEDLLAPMVNKLWVEYLRREAEEAGSPLPD